MDYYEEIKKFTSQEYQKLLQGSHKRSSEMSEPVDYPIKLDGIPPHILPALRYNIQQIQNQMWPDTPVKNIPISPGAEQTAIQLVLSAISQLPSTVPMQKPYSLGFGNKQFWLTFTIGNKEEY